MTFKGHMKLCRSSYINYMAVALSCIIADTR